MTKPSDKTSPTEGARVIIRLDRDLHRQMRFIAATNEMKVNDLIDAVMRQEIKAWEAMNGLKISELIDKNTGKKK